MNALFLADSVERYAELCALLDAPFVDRASILRSANLDEASFADLLTQWTDKLTSPGGADAARFGAAYAAARKALSAPRLAAEDDDTWPSDLAVGNRTAEIRCLRVAPALPFDPSPVEEESRVRRLPAVRRIYEPPIRPAPGAIDESDRTMEVPVFGPRPQVLPFVAPGAPGRWLHRFDTQTGLPLPNPLWSDDASANDPTKPV